MGNNHHNFKYTGSVPLSAGDRYYAQDLARDFYHLYDQIGSAILSLLGQPAGTAILTRLSSLAVDGSSPNTVIDLGILSGVFPLTVTIPGTWSGLPPPTTTFTANLPILLAAQNINVQTLGCSGSGVAYKLYASYSETNGNSRARAKASGSYNYEVTPNLTFGVTTGSIPAGSVLVATFTYNNGSSPITNLVPGTMTTVPVAQNLLGQSLDTLKQPGTYTLRGTTTGTLPSGVTATDSLVVEVIAEPLDGQIAGTLIVQTLRDITLGPSSVSYSFTRQSSNGGSTWSTWVSTLAPPINFVYIQGPNANDTAPATLYPGTTWANVSSEEAGAFRRFEGGNAAAFGSSQSDQVGPHNHSITDPGHAHIIQGNGASSGFSYVTTGTSTTNTVSTLSATTGISINSNGTTETRPVNWTTRKWRRTA